jgi:hypothetical protein
MKRISSGWTRFHKRIFPLLWFGFLAVFAAGAVVNSRHNQLWWPFVAWTILIAVLGFHFWKKMSWALADEVLDGGDFLLVRKGGDEERVPLGNVMHVDLPSYMRPQQITLRLVKPGKFGSQVSFALPSRFSFSPFAKHPLAEDLIVRVDRARRRSD